MSLNECSAARPQKSSRHIGLGFLLLSVAEGISLNINESGDGKCNVVPEPFLIEPHEWKKFHQSANTPNLKRSLLSKAYLALAIIECLIKALTCIPHILCMLACCKKHPTLTFKYLQLCARACVRACVCVMCVCFNKKKTFRLKCILQQN